MNAERDAATAQSAHRQRIVDLGGAGIVDREGLHPGQRQLRIVDERGLQRRKAGALGKMLEQEALPVELVGRVDGAGALQQVQRGHLCLFRGMHHGLVLGRVLVRLEQDPVELLADRLGALALHQFGGPGVDLGLDAGLLLDGGERLLHDLGRRLPEAALHAAGTAEIVRRMKQGQQRGSLLHQRWRILEVVACHVDEGEFFFGSKFPQQLHIHLLAQRLCLGQQFGGSGLVEAEHDMRVLDLDALAGIQLDLGGTVRLGQDAAGEELAGIFEHCKHGALFSHACRCARKVFGDAGWPSCAQPSQLPGGSCIRSLSVSLRPATPSLPRARWINSRT